MAELKDGFYRVVVHGIYFAGKYVASKDSYMILSDGNLYTSWVPCVGKPTFFRITSKEFIQGIIDKGLIEFMGNPFVWPYEVKQNNSEKMENDNVNHPKHYTSHPSGIECIEITRHYCFSIGNAIKYLWRAGLKTEGGMTDKAKEIQDLEKAIWYIKDRIKQLKGKDGLHN